MVFQFYVALFTFRLSSPFNRAEENKKNLICMYCGRVFCLCVGELCSSEMTLISLFSFVVQSSFLFDKKKLFTSKIILIVSVMCVMCIWVFRNCSNMVGSSWYVFVHGMDGGECMRLFEPLAFMRIVI